MEEKVFRLSSFSFVSSKARSQQVGLVEEANVDADFELGRQTSTNQTAGNSGMKLG